MRLRQRAIRTSAMAAVLSIAMVGVAACSGGTAGNSHSGGGSAEPGKPHGTLTVRIPGGLTSTDPYREVGTTAWQLLRQVYEGLVSLDNQGNPIPMLAKSWTKSSDGTTYTFHLRKGIVFHNGQKMTADDVVYSFKYYKSHALRKSQLDNVKNVSPKGKYTVRFTLGHPDGGFLMLLGSPIELPVVPKGSADNDGLVKTPIGTGPFEVAKFSNENSATLTAFKGYKPVHVPTSALGGHKEPLVKTIKILSVPNDQTAVAGIQTGQYSIANDPPTNQTKRIKSMPNVKLQETTSSSSHALYMNAGKDGVHDRNVRAAILAGINKKKLLKSTWNGQGQVTNTYIPPFADWRVKDDSYWPWSGGASQAKTLLAKSSYHGQSIQIIASSFQFMQQNAVLIQQQLHRVGIKTHIQQLDHTTYLNRIDSGRFQLASTGRPIDIPEDNTYNQWYCDHGKAPTRFNWCNNAYDSAYDKAVQITNPNKRAAAFGKLERTLKDAALFDPLYFTNMSCAVQDNVHGFKVNKYGWLNLWNVSVTG